MDAHSGTGAGSAGGGPPELDELLQQNLPALRAFVRLQVGEALSAKESCSDLVQTVCREALRDAGAFEFQGEPAFRKWLFQKAQYKILDRRKYYAREKRDVQREVRVRDDVSDADADALLGCYASFCTPSRDAIAREELARVEQAFQQLPEDQRELIALCRLADLTYAEAAEQTDRTEGQVRGLVARGLAKLARLLTPPIPS